MNTATETLKKYFGFDSFRTGQEKVISSLISGKSAAAVFPTGAGKSLCYQLPALMLPGLTIVVSPLIALMKDQIDALTSKGIKAARLDSTLSFEEYTSVMNDVRSGTIKLLYVAPERFNNERFRYSLEPITISLFAIDEAHCISEWGHNFRPDYLKIAGFAKECGAERILALTATATPKVLEDIRNTFSIAAEDAVTTGFYRPNLSLKMSAVSNEKRDQMLLDLISKSDQGPTIIYVTLQKTAEAVAEYLKKENLNCKFYHAGMTSEIRSDVQDWFMASKDGIVVATIAFGMGVDKSDIRYVYHYNFPKSLENYSQEIGRAGRDGKPSFCHSLICIDDLGTLENFIYGDTPAFSAISNMIGDLFSNDVEFDISLYTLSQRNDVKPLVLKTLLTYLELDGHLKSGTPFYSEYKFKPLVSKAEIINRFEGERQKFIKELFSKSKVGRIWHTINPKETAKEIGEDQSRITKAIDWMADNKLLEVKVSGVRNRFTRDKTKPNLDKLAVDLFERAQQRESGEIARLKQVLDLAEHKNCQTALLAKHFGETLDKDCGHCSSCYGETVELVKRNLGVISEDIWKSAQLLQEKHEILRDQRSLARFLCGVSSPGISKAKLTRNELFGSLAHISFGQVLEKSGSSTA